MENFFNASSKQNLTGVLCLLLLIASVPNLCAKPARVGWREVTGADGKPMKVRLAGDEFSHQYFTEDGYPLENRDGVFYHCNVTPTGDVEESNIMATAIESRNADATSFVSRLDKTAIEAGLRARALKSPMRLSREKACRSPRTAQRRQSATGAPYEKGPGLFPDATFPAYGKQKALVLLVEFSDVKFTLYDPHDYFSRMLGERGFADYGATGCAEEYFEESSGGAFQPEFVLVGPVTLSHPMRYYGANQGGAGNDVRAGDMIVEACTLADAEVDFSEFDRDGDGFIDNVYVFYAGHGEATCDDPNTIWPHSWNITQAFSEPKIFDGKRLDYYACSNEWETYNGKGRPDGVGTFIHEFSHVLGLPDLYETSYSSGAFTPGSWSVLDYGPYNNDGMTPPIYGAFERYALGWLKPREVDRPVNATLQPVGDNVAGIIRTSRSNEFFLIENRQKRGWDAFIPGHGMLVWHIDYDAAVWSGNRVNNNPNHQYVDLEEADNRQTDWSRDGDSLPGASGIRSFTSQTRPAMRTWSGTAIDFPIYNITETADGNITFTVLEGNASPLPPTVSMEPENVSYNGFTAMWTPVEGHDHLLSVYTVRNGAANKSRSELTDEDIMYLPGYRNRNVGQGGRWVVEGTEENTEYFYTVAVTNGWETSEPTAPMSAYTGRRTIAYYRPEAIEATEITDCSFIARWQPLEDCTGYLLSLYLKENGNPYEDVCDFADGVKALPEGWESSSISSYSNASYSGAAIPSLRLGNTGDWLSTPAYTDGVSAVSFWHRGNGTGTDDKIRIQAYNGTEWEDVRTLAIETAKGGAPCRVENLPQGTVAVRIIFDRTTDRSSLAIDDVAVQHGMQYTLSELPGYTNLPVGDVTNFHVSGLQPDTEYAFSVRGTDGTLVSLESNQVMFRTNVAGGINGVTSGEYTLRLLVRGNQVTAPSGMHMVAFDAAGREVATGVGELTLPSRGIYIVSITELNSVMKIAIP